MGLDGPVRASDAGSRVRRRPCIDLVEDSHLPILRCGLSGRGSVGPRCHRSARPNTVVRVIGDVVRIEGVTRVQRTFAFVDVCGFTEYTDTNGDAAAVHLLETVRGNLRRLASVHGVRGVASGDVILFEGDDHIGQAVNLAARLSDLAGPDEILAPAFMQTSLLVNTTAVPHGEHHVKGIATPVEIVRFESR